MPKGESEFRLFLQTFGSIVGLVLAATFVVLFLQGNLPW